MGPLSRTGVSLEDGLLKEFDRLITKRGYANRYQAFRDLIRETLLSEIAESNKPVVGALMLVYDHHVPNHSRKLTEVQHKAGAMVLAASYIHLDRRYCLEVIIMKRCGKDLQAIAEGMLSLRGVESGKLVLTNSGAASSAPRARTRNCICRRAVRAEAAVTILPKFWTPSTFPSTDAGP